MFKRFALAGATLAALLSPALAADWQNAYNATVPVPIAAPALPAVPVNPCNVSGCKGFELGGNFTGSGVGINVANLGSMNAGGSYMGLESNYMAYNGAWLLGAGGKVEYEIANPPSDVIGGAFSNKLFWYAYGEAGGTLTTMFGMFGVQSAALPAWVTNAVTSVRVGGCGNGPLQGFCSSFHAREFLANSQWTVNIDYTNAQYNAGTAIKPGITGNTENRGSLGFSYHF